MKTILYWPDGTWCEPCDLRYLGHKSDDFTLMDIPDNYDDEQIGKVVVSELRSQMR